MNSKLESHPSKLKVVLAASQAWAQGAEGGEGQTQLPPLKLQTIL